MTRISAATDGQPRQQHWPPLAASHRTIARRPPTPSAAHRARRQRRRKASSHVHIRRVTIAPKTLPSSSSSSGHSTNHYLQQHLSQRRSRGIALSHQWHGIQTQERLSIRTSCIDKILARGQRFSRNDEGTLSAEQTFGEFKGCQRHSSKGGS